MSFVNLIGIEYKFAGKDGKEYSLLPLSLTEWGNYISWVQWKPYRDAIVAELPQEDIDLIKIECSSGKTREEIKEGEFKLFPISLGSTIVRDSFHTYDGINKLLHLSITIKHPELKGKSIGHIVDLGKMSEIQHAILAQNSLIDTDEEPEKNEQNPNTTST